ncbi:MAG: hypothetical protein SNF92_08205 [Rikenellaceae bacterium]
MGGYISREYTQLSRQIKLDSISATKKSSLTPLQKMELYKDLADWAAQIAERMFIAIQIDEDSQYDNK